MAPRQQGHLIARRKPERQRGVGLERRKVNRVSRVKDDHPGSGSVRDQEQSRAAIIDAVQPLLRERLGIDRDNVGQRYALPADQWLVELEDHTPEPLASFVAADDMAGQVRVRNAEVSAQA